MENDGTSEHRFRSKVTSRPLLVERRPNGRRTLYRDLTVKVRVHRKCYEITIRTGFNTDFSSIPTVLHWIVRWSRVDVAGAVHDWLYYTAALNREEADLVWWRVARSGKNRANVLQGGLCWLALRLFGWSAWHSHADNQKRPTEETGGVRECEETEYPTPQKVGTMKSYVVFSIHGAAMYAKADSHELTHVKFKKGDSPDDEKALVLKDDNGEVVGVFLRDDIAGWHVVQE